MSLLYLFRHGQAAASGLMVGQRDIPLSPAGEEEARQWGERLRSIPFSAAWSSPLQRAMQTARLVLAPNQGSLRTARPLPGLVEISLGDWEGMTKTEVIGQYPELWQKRGLDIANTAPPGGESLAGLSARVLPVFIELCREAAEHEYSLVVAHQAVNRAIIAHALGLPLEEARNIAQPPCALTVFRLDATGGMAIAEAAR